MAKKISLRHKQSGVIKSAPIGFSWTTFFFGGFPALFRGDLKWAVIMWFEWLAGLGLSIVTFGVTSLIFGIAIAVIYNKRYIVERLEEGYAPADDHSRNILLQAGISTASAAQTAESQESTLTPPTDPPSMEQRILTLAKDEGGVITPSKIAMETGCTLAEAKAELDELVNQGHFEVRPRGDGQLVYTVPDFLSDEKRADLDSIT